MYYLLDGVKINYKKIQIGLLYANLDVEGKVVEQRFAEGLMNS